MSDETKLENGAIPPRVTIKVPGQSGEVAEPTSAAPVESAALPAGTSMAGGKKKTSRISLDKVTAEPGAAMGSSVSGVGVASKTIRLAPAMTGQVSISQLPPVGKALTGTLIPDEGKRQTSRIPLDSVLSVKADAAGADAPPKTIKVKRPVLSSLPKVGGLPSDVPAAAPVAAGLDSMAKSQTARVDIVPEAAEPQQTQKKTIKIRRADGTTGGDIKPEARQVSISRGAEAATVSDGSQVAPPHVIFPILAAAAMLVLCFMLYVLAAQVFPQWGWSI